MINSNEMIINNNKVGNKNII